jgi:hypothetical protein
MLGDAETIESPRLSAFEWVTQVECMQPLPILRDHGRERPSGFRGTCGYGGGTSACMVQVLCEAVGLVLIAEDTAGELADAIMLA